MTRPPLAGHSASPRLSIDVVTYDGVDELDVVGPLEVFRRAARRGASLRAALVTRTPQPTVVGAHGIGLLSDAVFEPGRADVLVVPGGGWAARAATGAWTEASQGHWPAVLRAASSTTGLLAGVCTGTMLLARAGLIGARRATTHHAALSELAATGATALTDRVVDDGDLVTCGGVTSGIDLALWLVEREFGGGLADEVAAAMAYPRTRPTTAD